jgi:hypothetical protein
MSVRFCIVFDYGFLFSCLYVVVFGELLPVIHNPGVLARVGGCKATFPAYVCVLCTIRRHTCMYILYLVCMYIWMYTLPTCIQYM